MKIKFLVIFIILILILGLSFTFQRLPQIGYFIFPISVSISSLIISLLILSLLYQFARRREVIRRELEPEELEKALYECTLIKKEIGKVWHEGKPTGELYNKSWNIARKIAPNIKRLKKYKTFLQINPEINHAIYSFERLWEHYCGGTRIKTKGPYKEMGEELIHLYRIIK